MSNNIVGNAYRDIVEDVINSSRHDFEEFSVDETTLRELQLLWQERLTILGVATFPWDQSAVEPESANREAEVTCETSTSDLYAGSAALTSAAPQILPRPTMAALRSVQRIQGFADGERVPAEIAGYSVNGVMKRLRLDGMGALNIRARDIKRSHRWRIGASHSRSKIWTLRTHNTTAVPTFSSQEKGEGKRSEFILLQMDGASDSSDNDSNNDDNDNKDSDAINSDLDDPEDEIRSQENETEGSDAMILCLYDRVNRMKNKWNCEFRDGTVHVNGKDYLFGIAKGEFEW
ncbi:transcription factor IIA, alpha/beta subunit-domain-containing protein [Lipomyces chichibuensis]|uniref:transcription factor IIA, alpha/beta subunit-domain-containing protein n=1 Tax=Lipomyces chichibuensis TaxID=1546026 RepID=UPI003343BCF0